MADSTGKFGRLTRSRTKEEIFAAMHRELRAWNPEIPESPERLDPILRLLLQLYANQLSQIDTRIDQVWEVATHSLIRSLAPESMRWPVPAFTVIRCEPLDPVVEIDPHTKFFHKEKREGGQTFFFSALKHERLISAQIKHIFLRADRSVIDLSPQTEDSLSITSRPRESFATGATYQMYLGIDHSGPAANLTGAAVFLKGMPDVLKQLRWSYWYPGSGFGEAYEDSGFCPGMSDSLEEILEKGGTRQDWGGLRSNADLFKPLEDSFIVLPDRFTSTWEVGPPDKTLADLLSANGIELPDESERLYWIRLDLPPGGDKGKLRSGFEIHFNCFIAVNKNELTLFKHTGGNRLVEIELPEHIDNILEITGVVDSGGREYVARHLVSADGPQRFYAPEERDDHLVLWFDFSSVLELPPASLTINYSVTAGVTANGIEAGKIADLYENHPGISSAVNIVPTAGAIPAKNQKQIVTEVAARLRNRDRALNFSDIASWATSFDPRIRSARAEKGVERAANGVRRCIVVAAGVKGTEFYSDDEIELLRIRLSSFLKARSPVNTHYRVEIVRQ